MTTGQAQKRLFQKLLSNETGINFQNVLTLNADFDVFRYRNFYNGGGVGIADFNNDGLADVYLTSNMGDNKLYLNKGDLKFQDITETAGVKGSKIWSTGVSIADVNGDGLLDIYVSNAGDVKGKNRENELFINNGDLTFSEQAEKYGLADLGFSTHAAFMDYDKDGDLDCYILNNSYRPVSTLGYRNLRNERDAYGGHKLFRNDGGRFIDVSEEAGIYGSVIGFGLGVTVGDVNQDSWPDLYISNDFYERDYLYINNKNGTFTEDLERYMGHISMFSMGADLADLNNDGFPEIFSTDMLPEDPYRLKTLTAFESYDVYQLRLKNDYYHQFMRNMLHKNNRDGTFSEIGAMAGVEATDWSWGALMADFNNDLYKEIFVCNGIYKDLINQDFIAYLGSSEQMKAAIEGKEIDFKKFTDNMPSVELGNYMFTRTGEWQYENVADEWGLGEPGFSNGAAYGDLDNDGDLELVINNVNQTASVYKNLSRERNGKHYLAFAFKGTGKNTFGLGSSVKAFVDSQVIYFDHMPIRGFQSSMDYKMVIGLGDHPEIDSLIVTWPDNKMQVLRSLKTDQSLTLNHADAVLKIPEVPKKKQPFFIQTNDTTIQHRENPYNDFDRDRLLYHMMSTQGPAYSKADLNHDGLDDIFLGGSMESEGQLFLQRENGDFRSFQFFPNEIESADEVDAVFFDADGDKDLDLYVVTGGSEKTTQSLALRDQLYENAGMRNGIPFFKGTENRIPDMYQSGSCVRPADVDMDGDIDLFVGTRVIPSYYGLPCDQVLLLNDGKGNFTDVSDTFAPEFKKLGMVTDATWFDYDANGFPDLMIVGEWMPVTLFLNDGKQLTKAINVAGLTNTDGWWNRIKPADLDNDGDLDFVVGNLGLNSKFRPAVDSALTLYVNDFDRNGSIEPVFAFPQNDKDYPVALRQDIIKQMSSLKKKFVYYKDYADKSVTDIFDADLLANSTVLKFRQPRSGLIVNLGSEGFNFQPLPFEAQVSPIYGIAVSDVNGDNNADIILGGNLFSVKPEVGRYDALFGLLLLGDGKNNFAPVNSGESGLQIRGEVRHIDVVNVKTGKKLLFIRNNDSAVFYNLRK